MSGQRQERRVETDDLSLPLQHCTLQIVIERDAGTATPGGYGADMAAQEVLHMSAEIEAQEDLARPGQHGHKAHQRPPGTTDLQMAEVTPIDLHLLAG